MNGRTRTVARDLALGVFSLVVNIHLLRELHDGFGWEEFDSHSAAIGAIETACFWYLAEHEPIASRLDDWPGELVFTVFAFSFGRLVREAVRSEESMSIGGNVGVFLYRLVFGVVFDLPDGHPRRWSSSLSSRVRSRLGSSVTEKLH